jgi:DNA-binding NarL/FixJ family response regulator
MRFSSFPDISIAAVAHRLTVMKTTKACGARRPAILVVEDHETLRFTMVSWLQWRFPGSEVFSAASGEEALEQACAFRPHIVLMDIMLPGIDGIEATRRMKAAMPGIAVVIVTTHDTPQHRLAAAGAGAFKYVVKHEIESELEPTIESLIRSLAGDSGCSTFSTDWRGPR